MSRNTARLRLLMRRKKATVAPGVFSPLVAQQARKLGFEALYFSGAAFSNLMGLPDLGVTTLLEVSKAVRDITGLVDLPLVVDADTGFGEAVNVERTVKELRSAGAAGLHIEDQVLPKRCGHLEGKELVDVDEMVKKLVAAKEAAEGEIVLIARTDARSVEGMEGAVERARTYARAGAEMIFPEALESSEEFVEFRRKVGGPLMANMTEFGKTPFTTAEEFGDMGYSLVIFPVTTLRAAMGAVRETLRELKAKGTQKGLLDSMMTREDVYDLIDYRRYEREDARALASARKIRGEG